MSSEKAIRRLDEGGGPLVLFVPPDITNSTLPERNIAVCTANGQLGGWLEASQSAGLVRGWTVQGIGSGQKLYCDHFVDALARLIPNRSEMRNSNFDSSIDLWVKVTKGIFEEKERSATALDRKDDLESDSSEAGFAPLAESSRLELLDRASSSSVSTKDPIQKLEDRTRKGAVKLLGGEETLGRVVRSDEDLVQALTAGLPAQVIPALQEAGYSHDVLERVVAPRRTLMRRRGQSQRLTRAESDAAWRLARALVLATEVLNGRQAALDWLNRAKPSLGDRSPIAFLETSVGTAYIERILRQLDWGDVA